MRHEQLFRNDDDHEQLSLLFARATAPEEANSPRLGEGMVPPETVENPMREEEDINLALEDLDVSAAADTETERPDLSGLLDELSPGLGDAISRTFRRMELAEEEIETAKRHEPARAERIHGAFRYLRPTESLQGKGDELYRTHCRELITRVAAGAGEKELALGTRSEVVATLADLSLAAPLERTAALLYGRLFEQLFPQKAAELEPALRVPHDAYEEELADELESRLRRKLATERALS